MGVIPDEPPTRLVGAPRAEKAAQSLATMRATTPSGVGESQRSSRVRVPPMGPSKRYSSPGRPTLPAAARLPTGTSVPEAKSVEKAFLKLLVFNRINDGSR